MCIGLRLFSEVNSIFVYRANGFAYFRSCCTYHKRKSVVRFSIAAYGSMGGEPLLSLPCV